MAVYFQGDPEFIYRAGIQYVKVPDPLRKKIKEAGIGDFEEFPPIPDYNTLIYSALFSSRGKKNLRVILFAPQGAGKTARVAHFTSKVLQDLFKIFSDEGVHSEVSRLFEEAEKENEAWRGIARFFLGVWRAVRYASSEDIDEHALTLAWTIFCGSYLLGHIIVGTGREDQVALARKVMGRLAGMEEATFLTGIIGNMTLIPKYDSQEIRILLQTLQKEDILGYPASIPLGERRVIGIAPALWIERVVNSTENHVILFDELDKPSEGAISAVLTLFYEYRLPDSVINPRDLQTGAPTFRPVEFPDDTILVGAMQERFLMGASLAVEALQGRSLFLPVTYSPEFVMKSLQDELALNLEGEREAKQTIEGLLKTKIAEFLSAPGVLPAYTSQRHLHEYINLITTPPLTYMLAYSIIYTFMLNVLRPVFAELNVPLRDILEAGQPTMATKRGKKGKGGKEEEARQVAEEIAEQLSELGEAAQEGEPAEGEPTEGEGGETTVFLRQVKRHLDYFSVNAVKVVAAGVSPYGELEKFVNLTQTTIGKLFNLSNVEGGESVEGVERLHGLV